MHQTARRAAANAKRFAAINRRLIVSAAKARDVQWDYKNIARRKGRLERLK
jgi:hypothetical protein